MDPAKVNSSSEEEDDIEDDVVKQELLPPQDEVSPSPASLSIPVIRTPIPLDVDSTTPPDAPFRRAAKKEPSDTILNSPQQPLPSTSKDPIRDLPPVKKEASDTILSSRHRVPLVVKDEILDAPLPKLEPPFSPTKPILTSDAAPTSSAPARRTPEEIAALKLAAQVKVRPLLAPPPSANLSSQLKATKQKQTREATLQRYSEVASRSLGEFGFVAQTGTTRFGTGKGGEGAAPTEEWKPDERCSEEQRAVLESVKGGDNFFFTGSAGESSAA